MGYGSSNPQFVLFIVIIGGYWIWNYNSQRHRTINKVKWWHRKLTKTILKYIPNIFTLVIVLYNDVMHNVHVLRQT